jgi:hypothetical protein
MVEINPRASGGLTITALSGADTGEFLKKEIVDDKSVTQTNWKEITVTRYFEEKIVK